MKLPTLLQRLPWRQILLLLVALALLGWVISEHSLTATLSTLAQLQASDLLLLAAVNVLVLSTFTGRWWLLLEALGQRVPYLRLLGYRLTGFAISYFTPGSHFGGEPYQVYAVSRWHGASLPVSLAAVTLDKLLEMLINLAFLLVGVVALLAASEGLGAWIEWQLTIYSIILLAIPCGLLLLLWRGRHPLTGMMAWVERLTRQRIMQRGWAQAIHQSEAQTIWLCRTHPRVVGMAFGVTLITWVGVIGEFWLLTRMLGLALTPLEVTASLVAARIAILLPVPAGLGALEAGQVLAMESLGVDPSVGMAMALVIRARDVVSGLIGLALGGAHLWQRTVTPPVMPSPQAMPEATGDPQHSISPP